MAQAAKAEAARMTISVEGEFDDLSYRVIGVALEVLQVLGPGLLESMYHAAMRVALRASWIQV